MAAALDQAAGHVVAVADPGQSQPGQLAAVLLQRVQIGQRLAGMGEVGQAVDHRARRVLGELHDRRVPLGPHDDHVDHFAEHAGEIGDALALAEAGVLAQHDAAAAQVGHAGLEADARPQRRLLEQQRQHAARQQRLAQALRELGLEILGDRKDPLNLGGGNVGECKQMSHGSSREQGSGSRELQAAGRLVLAPAPASLACSQDVGQDLAAFVELVRR